VLVSSVDGVGTKLKVAFMTGVHDTVGIDLVAHCANDILVQGAKPLFFLDYIGMGSHDPDVALAVVSGVAEGCRRVGCALVGGETATMPDFYRPGEYDLAGTIVGVAERSRIVDGSGIRPGDALIGLGSDGLHTNGYSLARKLLFEVAGMKPETRVEAWGATVGEELLKPHRAYVGPIFRLLEKVPVRGMAHITGGGFLDNLPRILPDGLTAHIRKGTWPVLPVFASLKAIGDVSEREMYRVFNMGIGYVVVVPPDRAEETLDLLRAQGERAWRIGEVTSGGERVEIV
jgi:phosphoribosylformylglycinamidine cyclo-ligase